MAKFVRQTSDLAQALDRLQGFAETLISTETNRRIQLGREKETRMVQAYGYMLGEEDTTPSFGTKEDVASLQINPGGNTVDIEIFVASV